MKLTYFSRFPLLAGLMALWLSLSGAQAATEPAALWNTPCAAGS